MMPFPTEETCRTCTRSPLYCIVIVTTTPSSRPAEVLYHVKPVDQPNRSLRPLHTLHAHFSTATLLFSTLFFFSLCVPKLARNRLIYVLYNVKKCSEHCQKHHTINRLGWFRIPLKAPYHCSSHMVLYTITRYTWCNIVLIAWYTITHTWFRIPLYTWFLYTIVRYQRFRFRCVC